MKSLTLSWKGLRDHLAQPCAFTDVETRGTERPGLASDHSSREQRARADTRLLTLGLALS